MGPEHTVSFYHHYYYLRLEERQEKWVIPDHGGIEWWAREAGLDPESGRNPLDV